MKEDIDCLKLELRFIKNEVSCIGRVCPPNRLEKIETEIAKIPSIQALIEATSERLKDFATKNDIDKVQR